MPTYGYECKSCGNSFDFFQSMKDEPLKICPKCGKELRRLITGGTGIIFKGNGFYITDKGAKGGRPNTGNTAKTNESKTTEPKTTEGKTSETKTDGAKTGDAGNSSCQGCAKSTTPASPKAAND